MTQTTNYHLLKPGYDDPVDVKDLNDNMDLIDVALTSKANLVGGKVPASELPSYVDDVIEGYYYNGAFYQDSAHTTAISGETGKIYIDLDSETCYRWTGSVYVKISSAADALYVEFTESSGVYSCDTGLADMYDALDEGREVIGVYDNNGAQEKYYVGNYSETGDYVTFYSYNSTGKIAELFGTGSGSETWSYDEFSLTGGGGGQLPTATNLGDIPSWNPGTQLWEITHKGTITSGSTGYATGGDVYTAIGNIPQIPVGTNTGDILVWNGYDWVSKPKWQAVYQPVEYIESTGTQCIDSEVVADADFSVELDMAFTSTSVGGLVGTRDAHDGNWRSVACGIMNSLNFGINAAYPENWTELSSANTQRHVWLLSPTVQKMDGTVVANGDYSTISNTVLTFGLFARHTHYQNKSPDYDSYAQLRLYGCKMWDNEQLVRNFIPCYIIYTGEIGMFDTVENKFYTNAGTGTFLKGADV